MANIKIEMCRHYSWQDKPKCAKGHKAGLKCHSQREECPDYQPSEYYTERRENDGHK